MEEWREENLPECAIEAGGVHGVEITLEESGGGVRDAGPLRGVDEAEIDDEVESAASEFAEAAFGAGDDD
jgi:hypothetical protein